MVIEATIINQPYSGKFEERIYDNQSSWNSQTWTWIKFTENNSKEWCGQFRGTPRKVAVSVTNNLILVLTSDYLYQLNASNGIVLELEDQPQYRNLTAAPDGSFIIADYYNMERISKSLSKKEIIESPIQMDMIKFINWQDDLLEFTCDEFLNSGKNIAMIYDSEFNKIIKRRSQ